MLKILLIVFIATNVFCYDELTINRTYEGKIYKLYSVYSYKNDSDKYIGFLANELSDVIHKDNAALWEMRKYQVAKVSGSLLLLSGFFSFFFADRVFKTSGRLSLNAIIGISAMAVGYGVGFLYANYKLCSAVDTFNTNNKNQELEESKKGQSSINSSPVIATLDFEF